MVMVDLKPLQLLIKKHTSHKNKYSTIFRGIELVVYPEVLNPNYTKVSGFLSDVIEIKPGSDVLDMFCGSGAIGIVHSKNARTVLLADISPKAVQCATENVAALSLDKKVKVELSNIWESIGINESFDVIIANPPLLPVSPHTEFEKIFADREDMHITKKFIKGCSTHLKKGGVVYITTSTASNPSQDKKAGSDIAVSVAKKVGLKSEVIAELDQGYEIYRVVKLYF